MVGSFVRFLLFTRCEGSLNSLIRCAHSFGALTHSSNHPSHLVSKNRACAVANNQVKKSLFISLIVLCAD